MTNSGGKHRNHRASSPVNSCVYGDKSWTLESSKLNGDAGFATGSMTLGDKFYTYQDALGIIDANDTDSAVALATTLIGAKSLIASGTTPCSEVAAAIADADLLLSGYSEILPWQTITLGPQEAAAMDDLRQDLQTLFLRQIREA